MPEYTSAQTHIHKQIHVHIDPQELEQRARLLPRHAYFGFRLKSLIPGGTDAPRRVLLLTRLMPSHEPGRGRAIELRYVVRPPSARSRWREEVRCYLLVRNTDWRHGAARFEEQTRELAAQVARLLAHNLPDCAFVPLNSPEELEEARNPFPVADTGEVRRQTPSAPEVMNGHFLDFPLPFGGLPDADSLLGMMMLQSEPTLVAVCVEPVPSGLVLGELLGDNGKRELLDPTRSESPLRLAEDEDLNLRALLQVLQATATGALNSQAKHIAALGQRAYKLRVQMAGAGPLGDALVATLGGEVSGVGLNTMDHVWRDPTSPLATRSVWARPRSSRAPGTEQSEYAMALENLRDLAFTPWGSEIPASRQPERVPQPEETGIFLANLGEVARLFALPATNQWLPRSSTALALPYSGDEVEGTGAGGETEGAMAAQAKPSGGGEGLHLGLNHIRGLARRVVLPLESRWHHMWVVGQTGTGKSTLLEAMILQDIQAGRGVIVMDPHGDLIEQVLGKLPAERERDVILFDPADTEYPVGLNPLDANGEAEQAMVVSSFLGLLAKLYDPHQQGIVGPRFEHGARNGLLTIMSEPGNTLIELVRVMTDDKYLQRLLPSVEDPVVRRYWTDQIASTNSFHRSEVLDWIVSKFGRFVTDPTIRRIIGQSKSGFSFREAMDNGKIVLLSLAKGRVGGENATFLGLVLLPMILQAALSRVGSPQADRREVGLYIDEFQNYATSALAQMLAEARKYRLALTLANQHIDQLTGEIRNAVIGNVGSMLAFRLGLADAVVMERILEPSPVTAQHLNALPNFTAYGRLLQEGQRSPTFTLSTDPPLGRYDVVKAEALRAQSRATYGQRKAKVDREINRRSGLEG